MRIRTVTLCATFTVFFSGSGFSSARAGAQQLDQPVLIESFPVGNAPFWLTSDGDNIWVTNASDDTVTKLRASDGVTLGTFPVGLYPLFLTFDGANIWVGNNSGDRPGASGDSVTKLRASDGANLGTFDAGLAPRASHGMEPTFGSRIPGMAPSGNYAAVTENSWVCFIFRAYIQ